PLHMTRATSLLLSNGVFNANAKKMFHKSNTDFRVIGVLGAQSVGKSTLLNLLAAAEQGEDYDYYEHLISEADACIFRTRQRTKDKGKSVLRPRTDTLQFFITRERYVLLDTPPLEQLNQHSLNTIFQLLSVCHVVIIALDGLNMEQLRLLHAALRLRPSQGLAGKNLPQLLFVRTRALSEHYQPAWRERLEQQLSLLFGEFVTGEINCLLLPQLRSNAECVHHCGLPQLVRELWDFILGLPRLSSSDLSELQWFELLAETMRKCQFSSQHFDSVFTEIKQQQLEPRQKRANWRAET
ncbi:CG3857, partial [Drosophila busckii]